MNSTRSYLITGYEGSVRLSEKLSLKSLLNIKKDDYEYIYAIQEDTDKILDLKVNETMYVSLNRDNVNDKGVLLRVS